MSLPLAQVRLMQSIADMADVQPVLSKLLLIKDHMLDRENMRWAAWAPACDSPGTWEPSVPGSVRVGGGGFTAHPVSLCLAVSRGALWPGPPGGAGRRPRGVQR